MLSLLSTVLSLGADLTCRGGELENLQAARRRFTRPPSRIDRDTKQVCAARQKYHSSPVSAISTQHGINCSGMSEPPTAWYRELKPYHWFVLLIAALGWLFDCLDQQLFIFARQPAMKDLLHVTDPAQLKTMIDAYAGYATSVFLIGWASGGLLFGVLGDRIGRARTMLLTILVYTFFTGLSAISVSFWDFALYRFLTGLGVGGEFAVGVALVAEVMPERARPYALSSLQAFSVVGNVTAALLNMAMGGLFQRGLISSVWRPLFIVGAIPAILTLFIRRRLKEPERWQAICARRWHQRDSVPTARYSVTCDGASTRWWAWD